MPAIAPCQLSLVAWLICRCLTYEQRAAVARNPVAKLVFETMARKHTNLAVAADVATTEEMLHIANVCGPYICVLKTHVDVLSTWSDDVATRL